MKKTLKIAMFLLLSLILIVVLFDVWDTQFRIPPAEEAGTWTSQSPDGRFSVTGYSTKSLFVKLIPTMPGDGSFGPGLVVLRDNKTGKILQKAKVEEVSSAGDSVDWMIGDSGALWRKSWSAPGSQEPWKGDYVSVRYLEIWPLPDKDGKLPPPKPTVTFTD
jgi:hypothetical protein